MPFPALAIANEFIRLAHEKNRQLTPMELGKLVYFAQGWSLAIRNAPLINEPIQAWKFGPVIPSVYHAFKRYGSGPITSYATSDPFDSPLWGSQEQEPIPAHEYSIDDGPDKNENQFAKRLVHKIWEQYGQFNAIQLSNLTHDPSAPWSQTEDKDKQRGVEIDPERIRKYFLSQISAQDVKSSTD